MLILLPPSEGKTPPPAGPSLDFSQLSYPQFNQLRAEIADELIEVSQRLDALDILQVGTSVSEAVFAQQNLFTLPCAPAREVYTGVLFTALDLPHASTQSLSFAEDTIMIFSGLFGVLSPNDFIPAYRLSMGTKLPKLGNNKTLWKRALKDFHYGEGELVIDCRSGNYQVWNPPLSSDWVTINAVREVDGKRKVVSHYAKHYRGILAHELVDTCTNIDDGEQLAEFIYARLASTGEIANVELAPPPNQGARKLTLVLH